MKKRRLNHCPIAFALDIFGDRWSLLILRDVLFKGKRRYKDLMESSEGIATNVLAQRLARLEARGILSKEVDQESKKQFIYQPTRKGLDLLPVLLELVRWSAIHDSETAAPSEFVRRLRADPAGLSAELLAPFSKIARVKRK